ncbi:MAG: UDP-glucose/GDP-mannose dehydrogenase family protein [Candidatus Omnitrophica bacterium]|nr:UDP-glucose/GDP-mannose dehydrogenase family protein [Candidatus Omnitrophota bacterium]
MQKIAIIGTGYVGLVTGACLAELGNRVSCIDNDMKKIKSLKRGKVTIFEPRLEQIVRRNLKRGHLSFSSNISQAIKEAEVVFICVSTPPRKNGEPDLVYVERVTHEIAKNLNGYKLIVEKSTVPVETGEFVKRTINSYIEKFDKKKSVSFDVVSNPEFLSEGSAIKDFMCPDRIVIGVDTKKAERIMRKLYKPLRAPVIITDIKGAEIVKHAANAFLATKISFINAISNICDYTGADVKEVAKGIGMDKRINENFLNAGIGFGGSCFPKDISAFIHICDRAGYGFDLLKDVKCINIRQRVIFVSKIQGLLKEKRIKNGTICVLGLSFKPNTDDIRNAPSLDIIRRLVKKGARIRAFDPQATKKAKKELGIKRIKYCNSAYEAIKGSDCLALVTEWDEFRKLDFKKVKRLLKSPIIVDGRNIYNPKKMKKMGFSYEGMGRKA